MLKVDVIDSISKFDSLRNDWNTLLDKSSADNIFLTWEWQFSWWQYFGKGKQLFILVSRDENNALKGIAPLYIANKRFLKLIPYREVHFIGEGDRGTSEYLDFICHEEVENATIEAFLDFIYKRSRHWHVSIFSDMREESKTKMHVVDYLNKKKIAAVIKEKRPFCPVAQLPNSWDDYLKSLPRQLKANIRSSKRKIEKDFKSISFYEHKDETDKEELFNRFIKLYSERREQKSELSRYGEDNYRAFQKQIVDLFSQNNWLYLYILAFDGEDAATQYGFRYKNTLSYYHTGLNAKFERYGPGQVLIEYAIEKAIKDGIKTYDLLRGEEWYKTRWTNEMRKKAKIIISADNIMGNIYIQYLKLRSALSSLKNIEPPSMVKNSEPEAAGISVS